jgi:hypothetical protein
MFTFQVLHCTTFKNVKQSHFRLMHSYVPYFIKYSVHFFYTENNAEILHAHYTWKVAEKGFKMAIMMNKLAMINYCKIILEK